jgi:PAS domain S-box-containing protein
MINLLEKINQKVSLSVRIIAGALFLFLVGTGVQAYLASNLAHQSALADIQTRLASSAKYNSKELQYRIDRLSHDVLFLSKTPPVQGIIRASTHSSFDTSDNTSIDGWKERLAIIFKAFIKTNPEYYQIRYIGLSDGGRELLRVQLANGKAVTTPKEELQQKQYRDYFATAITLNENEVFLSDINLNREFGKVETPHKPTMRAVTPVYTEAGEIFGLIVINMDIKPTLEKLKSSVNKNFQTFLINKDGDFLVHPNETHTFGFDRNQHFKWQYELKEINSLTADLNNKNQPSENALTVYSFEGKKLYGTSSTLHFDPLNAKRYITLTYAASSEYANTTNSALSQTVIYTTLLIAGIISFLLFYYVRQLFKPLNNIIDVAHLVRHGYYPSSFPTTGGGEVKRLSLAFKSMLERIALRDAEIFEKNKRLVTSLNFADLIIDSMPEAIIIIDSNGLITRANIQFEHFFGYSREQVIGQPLEVLLPETFRHTHISMRQDYLKAPTSRMMGQGKNLYARRKDGSEFPVEIGLSTIINNEETHILAAIIDISERQKFEQQQLKLLKEVSATNEELNSFTYIASHDLKSPLRGIDQLATWIEEDMGEALTPDTQHHLHLMRSRIDRMEKLLDDLLTYSRVGKSTDEKSTIHLTKLVHDIFDLQGNQKNIQLQVSELPTLYAQKVPIDLIFRNLISNAIKHHNKTNGIIDVSAKPVNGFIEFAVRDDGSGIPPEHHTRIFAMFQTLKSRDQVEGSGIGLSLVKKSVEMLGGSVRVESDGISGCCFYFTLPKRLTESLNDLAKKSPGS